MNRQLLLSQNPTLIQHEQWGLQNTLSTLFKCTTWQVEQTMDPIDCPYHYFCESAHPDNYPPTLDTLLLLFTTFSYAVILTFLITDLYRGTRRGKTHLVPRYLIPSGQISLPIFLLALANGKRINTVFPLSCVGPAILQLIHVSALAFDNESDKDNIKYAFFKVSTISGILHASHYLDSTILPYYTGFDALVSSTFSGECVSCICRKEVLVPGGRLVSYRGWSKTTFLVLGTLCLRILSRVCAENNDKAIIIIKFLFENMGMVSILMDCIYLITSSPPERNLLRSAAFAGVFVLIFLNVIRKAHTMLTQQRSTRKDLRWETKESS